MTEPTEREEPSARSALAVEQEWSLPHINLHHIDGPLLTFSDGQLHWLTWRERLQLWRGKSDAWMLQLKHKPHLCPSTLRSHSEGE